MIIFYLILILHHFNIHFILEFLDLKKLNFYHGLHLTIKYFLINFLINVLIINYNLLYFIYLSYLLIFLIILMLNYFFDCLVKFNIIGLIFYVIIEKKKYFFFMFFIFFLNLLLLRNFQINYLILYYS